MGLTKQQLLFVEERKVSKRKNRKNHNQYFTPEFVVEKAFSFIQETKIETVIDPAVGNAVFLKIASRKWNKANLFGIDVDKNIISDLKQVSLPNSAFICANSLLKQTWGLLEIQTILLKGGFDLIVGNPPFSSWFNRIDSKEILSNYQLAHKNGKLSTSLGIEILFLEVFINLAKERGFVVIILPDGVLSNPQYKYVREFILGKTRALRIISLPRNIFVDTSAKTSLIILQKTKTNDLKYSVEICDLDKTGKINNTIKVRGEDLLNRMDYYYYYNLNNCSLTKLIDNGPVFIPLRNFVIYCKTGKTLYGEEREFSIRGLRFLHATNITEIGINYKKDEKFIDPISKMNFSNAYAKVGDILFVRVGVGCAGRVAIVDSKEDEGVASDYIHILRVNGLDPHFLVVYLKTRFGKGSINLLKHGVGTVSVNKTDLLSLQIPIVTKDLQVEIRGKYKDILAKYRKNPENIGIKKDMSSLIFYLEEKMENLRGECRYVEV